MVTEKTIRLTTAQALVKFLNQQYIEVDGEMAPFVDGIFTLFGHGNVVGIGQALEEAPGHLKVYQEKMSRAWRTRQSLMQTKKSPAHLRVFHISRTRFRELNNSSRHRTCKQFTCVIPAGRHIRNQTARPSFATIRA